MKLQHLLALAALVCVSACDPCAGTGECGASDPRLAIDGQIVRARDGRGVDGVRITVLRTGGTIVESDSLSAVTANGGFWHVETAAHGTDDVVAEVRVSTPDLVHPYVVRDLHIAPVQRHGESVQLPRWVADPYFPYYAELFRRGAPDSLLPSTVAIFHQTGGPLLRGSSGDSTVTTGTDVYGRAQLFLYNAFASDTGKVRGFISVDLQPPYAPTIASNVELSPAYLYRAPATVPRFGVGPSLEYSAAVFDRATGRTIPNMRVVIERVGGGIDVDPVSFSSTTDAFGYVHFHFFALGTGNLMANVRLFPPAGNPEVFRDTIPTFDSDTPRLHANWIAGAFLPYYGIVRSFGQNVAGAPVRIRRVSGIDVSPADTVVLTGDNGVVNINPRPLAAGSVTLELTFTPPAPYPRFMIRNVVISTIQASSSGFNVWTWDLDRGITGPPGSEVVILP